MSDISYIDMRIHLKARPFIWAVSEIGLAEQKHHLILPSGILPYGKRVGNGMRGASGKKGRKGRMERVRSST